MNCTCGHTADHHANKGKNPALSFCVESCCPCEAYKPRRSGPRGAFLAMMLFACGGTVDPQPEAAASSAPSAPNVTVVQVDAAPTVEAAASGKNICRVSCATYTTRCGDVPCDPQFPWTWVGGTCAATTCVGSPCTLDTGEQGTCIQ